MKQEVLAEKLRVARARRGLTIAEASRGAGVERHTLRDLELARRTPAYPTLHKLATFYDMDVAELMVEEVEPSPKATALPETAGTVEERRTVPKGPPPSTMEELLTRAGVENNYLAMS